MPTFLLKLLTSQLLAAPLLAAAPPLPAADCQRRIEHAYDQFEQLQRNQQGGILELHFTAGTTYYPPRAKKLATTTAHFTVLSKLNHTYLSNGEVDLYQDDEVQVSIMHRQHTILITANQAQMPNVLSQWLKMREQVKSQTKVTNYALQEAKGKNPARRFIEARPLPGSSLLSKVASIGYWLDPRTDALQQMVMYYPAGSGLQSASLVIDSQRVKTQDAAVDLPALSHVFGTDKQLLPAYRSFMVQDLRHS